MFRSTKRFGPIPTCHRNWVASNNQNRDSHKCALIHGYSRHVQLTFEGELDEQQWVYDFGDCKFVKELLDREWDHRVLISSDDPNLSDLREMESKCLLALTVLDSSKGWGPGIEGSCKYLYDVIGPQVQQRTNGRVRVAKVEVWEHENNSAMFVAE